MKISFDPEMRAAREVPDISFDILKFIAPLIKASAIYLKVEDKYYLLWEAKSGRA